MKFSKPALSIEQQLDLLIRRGMLIGDRAVALRHLQHISILDLYSFDRKLRLLVMDAIERVEVSIRARWVCVMSVRYGPHSYLDGLLFKKVTDHAKSLTKLQEELERSKETFVLHYNDKYTEPELPPIWSISELLTFGQLSQWFKNIKDASVRVEIAKPYGLDEQLVRSFAHHLSYVRNVCAHHMRLWNREATIGMKLPARPAWLGTALNHEQPKRLYNTLLVLAYLINIISPGSRWRTNLLALFDEHPAVNLNQMGFPADWKSVPAWNEVQPGL